LTTKYRQGPTGAAILKSPKVVIVHAINNGIQKH